MDSNLIYKLSMSPEQVERFQTFFMERSGLVFEGRRTPEMEKAVARRMIELGVSSFEDYYHLLHRPGGEHELNHLAISLTVGETRFFRTPDQFAALRKYVLPELIERRRGQGRRLRLLSAGCSTGEEPYSLAILLHELIPDFDQWRLAIVACDINLEFLAAAESGVYAERKLRLVDPATRALYFKRLSKNQWAVGERLRQPIEWRHFNIMDPDYAAITGGGGFDLILCRNVLIYFKPETIQLVIQKLYEALEPEGYLLLGYSETLFRIAVNFQSIHTPEAFFYKKLSGSGKWVDPTAALRLPAGPLEREELLEALGSRPHPRALDGPAGKRPPLRLIAAPEAVPGPASRPGPEPAPAGKAASGVRPALPPLRLEPPPGAGPDGEEKLWREALALFAEEKFEDAGARFERLLEHNPASARGRLGLAFIHANAGDEDGARLWADQARRLDDLMPESYFLAALLDEKGGEFNAARQNYERVILLDPDFAMAHFNLGALLLKVHRPRDARREFRNAKAILERDPQNRSLYFSGGLSRAALIEFCQLQLG